MDDAAANGLDVISISVDDVNKPFYNDTIAARYQESDVKGKVAVCDVGGCVDRVLGVDLNYPSLMVIMDDIASVTVTYTATHVRELGTAYNAWIKAPSGTKVNVRPISMFLLEDEPGGEIYSNDNKKGNLDSSLSSWLFELVFVPNGPRDAGPELLLDPAAHGCDGCRDVPDFGSGHLFLCCLNPLLCCFSP
ncbi:uncharacterized protein A4U43_C05F22610 [Asparagus officinalis]|uniref:Subtilisin-like protease fibronectin type-III domain-containing protein n=1 Tax=Asparagus officinalis TaxID=4686 RepID=A0A5P1EUD1_ASPOF|nr:uncharacterized protein A4U43_C05F22610 [Asparagus officinalis]